MSKHFVKLYNFRTFLVLLMPIIFILVFVKWNLDEQKPPAYIFEVRVSIPPKDNETEAEFYWRSKKRLFPQIEIPNPVPQGLPNDDTFLVISIEKDGKLKLNSEDFGATLEDPIPLTEKLSEFFSERESRGAFEPQGNKIIKAVVVKSPRSLKYGEFIKVIDAVKTSGAEPIVLQIDELPE